ncbi:MAG TPA: DoxX family protein [Rhodopila sp.]|nr:DoxX family protein [Rhodopila sp.]
MRSGATDWIALVGRVLLSAIFLWAGYGKAMAPSATMAVFGHLGLPMPGLAYAVALIVEIGCGLLVLVGFKARLSALVLAGWCIVTALVAHDHPAVRDQMIHFMKNVSMAGGFLQIVAFGAGRFSVDRS